MMHGSYRINVLTKFSRFFSSGRPPAIIADRRELSRLLFLVALLGESRKVVGSRPEEFN
jgi:hypothetical protein